MTLSHAIVSCLPYFYTVFTFLIVSSPIISGRALENIKQGSSRLWSMNGQDVLSWLHDHAPDGKRLYGTQSSVSGNILLNNLAQEHQFININEEPDTQPTKQLVGAIERLGGWVDVSYTTTGDKTITGINFSRTAINDEALKHLSPLSDLQYLNLSDTKLTGAGLKFLPKTTLKELVLDNTPLGDLGLQHLEPFVRLEKLSLGQTQIRDDGLAHLRTLVRLQELKLSNTRITDDGLKSLEGLKALRKVNLEGTGITNAGIQRLTKLTELEVLNV